MDILLISGPLTDPAVVTLAVPALAAYLRSEGFAVEAWDLSIDSFDMLASKPFLSDAIARIRRRHVLETDQPEKERRRADALALTLAPMVIDGIEGAKATFRDKEQFYDYDRYKNAQWILQAVPPILHAAYFPTKTDKLVYDFGKEPTVEHILAHLTDASSNVFLAYFTNEVIPRIESMSPPLIALSISWESQLLPSLTLCRLLREGLPDVPIILGGGYVTAMRDRLETEQFLWDLATGIVLYEGESALAEICRRVKEGKDPSHIPNLFQKGDQLHSRAIHIEDMRRLPTPDFAGLHLDRYFVPEPVLPVQSNRGCYWNKCAFCASLDVTRRAYRQRPLERFIEDMTAINAATGATMFFVCDLATPPRYMQQLADCIRTRELPFQWGTEARFDPDLDEAACRAIADGGCLTLSFGFESASDRVLTLMRKGTTLSNVVRVLEACKKAGLDTTLFSFMGFPGETLAEAHATRDFFLKNTHLYTSCALSSFGAAVGCEVARHPERYNVSIIDESRALFTPTYEIEVHEGISPQEAQTQCEKALTSLFLQTNNLCTMWGGAGSPHDLLYLRRHGGGWRETLDKSPRLLDTELNTSVYTVSSDVAYKEIDDDEYILYRPTVIFAIVPKEVAGAMRLLQSSPQSIPAAALQIVGGDSLGPKAHYEAFNGLVLHLLNLAKAEFLVKCGQ